MNIRSIWYLAALCCLGIGCAHARTAQIAPVPPAPIAEEDPPLWGVYGRIHLQWFDDTRILIAVDSASEGREPDGVVDHLFLINLAYPESPGPGFRGGAIVMLDRGVLRVATSTGKELLLVYHGQAAATGGVRPPPGAVPRALIIADDTQSGLRLDDFDRDSVNIECLGEGQTGCYVLLAHGRMLKFPMKMTPADLRRPVRRSRGAV
jgi:hypothetical protein